MIRINRVDYLYNLWNNIVKMNGISYNIQRGGQCLIIVDNNERRINTLSFVNKLCYKIRKCEQTLVRTDKIRYR